MQNAQEKRVNKRLKSRGITVDIDNGTYIVDGYIDDISFNGIKVIQLPNRFFIQKTKSITVTTENNLNFKFKIHPCWINRKFPGDFQEVGFKIIDPPASWLTFVQDINTKNCQKTSWN